MPPPESDTQFFGHPRGLATLFLTEMGERFNFYGVRGLLILFMTASAANGGLGFDVKKAAMIYGLYMSSVYLLSLPGGWIADRLLGARRAVLYGGLLISVGEWTAWSVAYRYPGEAGPEPEPSVAELVQALEVVDGLGAALRTLEPPVNDDGS